MNILTIYYDRLSHEFYDPLNDNRRVWGYGVTKLDLYRYRVAVTTGKSAVSATTGIPTSGGYDLTTQDASNVVFTLKTGENDVLEDDGDISHGKSGFDTTDTAWHALASGRFTIQDSYPLTLAAGFYVPAFVILDSQSSPNSQSLDGGEYPLQWEVKRRAYTGGESTAVSGAAVTRWYDATILAGTDSISISITSFTTATGKGIPVQTGGSPTLALSYTKAAGIVTIRTTGPAPEDIPVAFRLESL